MMEAFLFLSLLLLLGQFCLLICTYQGIKKKREKEVRLIECMLLLNKEHKILAGRLRKKDRLPEDREMSGVDDMLDYTKKEIEKLL